MHNVNYGEIIEDSRRYLEARINKLVLFKEFLDSVDFSGFPEEDFELDFGESSITITPKCGVYDSKDKFLSDLKRIKAYVKKKFIVSLSMESLFNVYADTWVAQYVSFMDYKDISIGLNCYIKIAEENLEPWGLMKATCKIVCNRASKTIVCET